MVDIKEHAFPNVGFITAKIPDNILDQIKQEIKYISDNRSISKKGNLNLAGQIEDEFYLTESKEWLQSSLIELANFYNYKFPTYSKRKCNIINSTLEIEVGNIWVNFQKKYEFNPTHNHSGVFSFVIWINIPYNLDDEFSLPNAVNSRIPKNSLFNFSYTNILGEINNYNINVDSTYEGTILFFPSSLNHEVYPFYTSSDERISISGNLYVKTVNTINQRTIQNDIF